jgi:predicted acylesterase/phospholipase RssA
VVPGLSSPIAVSLAIAVNALKFLPLFRNTSLRLLSDMVDLSDEEELGGESEREMAETALLAVARGVVRLAVAEDDRDRIVDRRFPGGSAFIADKRKLEGRRVRAQAIGATAHIRRFDRAALTERVLASPSLLRSLDGPVIHELAPRVDWRPRLHTIWVAKDPELDVPLEALAFLLGAAIAQQFWELTAVAVLRDEALELWIWDGDGFVAAPRWKGDFDEESITRLLVARGIDFVHLLVLHPRDSHVLPPHFGGLRCHRVVELTRRMPTEAPAALVEILRREVRQVSRDGEPYFSSFVPTILLPATGGTQSSEVQTERIALDDEDEPAVNARRHRRLRRDSCRLRLETSDIARRWRTWKESPGRFPSAVLNDETLRRSLFRWARAVTNRRVGVALSGGGASTYRMVPFLEGLDAAGVPVDVVSGVSGGTLLGAYYCKAGRPGLELCKQRGWLFQACLLLASVDSIGFQTLVDVDLGHTTVDDLEVPLIGVTTALRDGKPPEPRVVTRGTLGRAVRMSGSLPVLFAPTETRGTRFADGATSALVPALPLRDFGADMVIACNCVPAARERNPFAVLPFGETAYRYTPIGRIVDLCVSAAGLLQRVSREAEDDAHVFVEVPPTDVPFVESFRFYDADGIAQAAAATMQLEVRRCTGRWMEFAWSGSRS